MKVTRSDDDRYVILPDRVSIMDTRTQTVAARLSRPVNAIRYAAGMNRTARWGQWIANDTRS